MSTILLFKKSEKNQRILTWGDAGVGKTTFCSKLAQDWAEIVKGRENPDTTKLTEEQRHLLSNIGLVLYIVLRDTHESQSLDDIVEKQILTAIGKTSFTISDQKCHKDLLLVCDGLDEVSFEKCKLLEILAGKMYPNVRCIVTCRPHASLGMSLTADAEIRLKGFSKQQARHFVDIYFRQIHPNTKLAEQKSRKLWVEIESFADLLEMAKNPSMLQLLCKLFSATGKIAKDRANVFKDYTYYLLQQYHIKSKPETISQRELKKLYKIELQNAGKLALQGLKQSHFQLIFTKENVIEFAGKEMFDIGFVTEVPGHGFEKPKAQFQHKTHQEYLAARFIVKSADDIGMKYLMEFCSTSMELMSSEIILTFVIAMSKRMGRVIQRKIRELISSWGSEDNISPKDRTSFLLTMLKENKSLSFPLPKEIDINVSEYEKSIGWIQKILQKLGKKNALEKFFSFENRGVQKVTLVLGNEYRLELMKGFRNLPQLQEVLVNFQKKILEKDPIYLKDLIESNQKLTILSMEKLLTEDLLHISKTSEFVSSLEKSNHLKTIRIAECELDMNIELAAALKHFPRHLELDISGNKFTGQSGCTCLIQKATHLESLKMQDCGIIIDTEIAEVISRLPKQASLDMSGNTVTKMDSSLLCHVIPVISKKKIDLSGLGVLIDDQVAQKLCHLDTNVEVALSGNIVAQMDYQLLCRFLYRIYRTTKVNVSKNSQTIEASLLHVIYMKHKYTNFDIIKNDIKNQDIILSLIVTADKWKPRFQEHSRETMTSKLKNDYFQHLQGHVNVEICDTHVPQMRNYLLHLATTCMATQEKVDLSHIQFTHNENTGKAIMCLPNNAVLLLSGHQIKSKDKGQSKDTCLKLIKKAGALKALKMHDCGIIIEKEIAEAISQLPNQADIDLSGNTVTKMDSRLLCHVIPVISNKKIDLSGLGVVIDAKVAQAIISSMDKQIEVDISDNIMTHMDYEILCQLLYKLYRKTYADVKTKSKFIKTRLLDVIQMKHNDMHFDITYNDIFKQNIILSMFITANKWEQLIVQHNKETMTNQTTTGISEHLHGNVRLDIHDPVVPRMRNHIFPLVISCMANQEKVDLSQILFSNIAELEEPLLSLPDHVQLDLSSHHIGNNSTSVGLIKKAGNLSALIMQDCGITIDTEIAEAISQLPEQANLDLSGNTIKKMDSSLLCHVIPVVRHKKIDLSGLGVAIDEKVGEAIHSLDEYVEVDLSGNSITHKSVCTAIIHKAATIKSLSVSDCGVVIDTELAEVISELPEQANLDLSGNTVTKMDSSLLCHVIPVISNKKIELSGLGLDINDEVVKVLCSLNKQVEVDLSGNQVRDKYVSITLIDMLATMRSLTMS